LDQAEEFAACAGIGFEITEHGTGGGVGVLFFDTPHGHAEMKRIDEAQNSTLPQMKMFLTRLGFRSKMVVTGDITQVDLPEDSKSGLIHAQGILKNIDGIRVIQFKEKDVVRHELVKKIVRAYDQPKS